MRNNSILPLQILVVTLVFHIRYFSMLYTDIVIMQPKLLKQVIEM